MLKLLVSILLVALVSDCTEGQPRISSGCEDKSCSHECVAKVGIPTCTCPADMILGKDKKTCQASLNILLGMFRGISMYTEGSGDYRSIFTGKTNAFDFHYGRKEIFAYSNNTISRFFINDKLQKPKTVLTTETMVTSLAVDWVHDDLYWVCQQKSVIEAASMNGSKHQVILSHNDTSKPAHWHNLVIDPLASKLFWLGDTQIFVSDLAGSQIQSRLPTTTGLVKPEDITLDIRDQLIYIIGSRGVSGDKVVMRSKYDGSQASEVLSVGQSGSEVYGFGVLGKTLYWESSHDGENLYKSEIPKSGEKPKIVLVEELYQVVFDMKIFHPDVQKALK